MLGFMFMILIAGIKSFELCSELQNISSHQLCRNGNPRNNLKVSPYIGILDVNGIDEDKQSISLQLQIILEWFDDHISLAGPNISQKLTYEIPNEDYDELHIPKLMFLKSKNTEIVPLYGDIKHSVSYFWMFWDQYHWKMEYSQSVKIELGCYFQFADFPFDQGHDCQLKFFTPAYTTPALQLLAPHIFDPSNILENENGTGYLEIEDRALSFEIKMRVLLKSPIVKIKGFNHSVAGIAMKLDRNKRNLIMTNYFLPTGLFAALSIISFVIKPEIVPGRMGMLVTMFLISITVYSSVDAPKSRGFSLVEIWMIGNMIPIIVAVTEYGIILYLIRNADSNKINEKKMKMFDLFTMIGLVIYLLIFHASFWIPYL